MLKEHIVQLIERQRHRKTYSSDLPDLYDILANDYTTTISAPKNGPRTPPPPTAQHNILARPSRRLISDYQFSGFVQPIVKLDRAKGSFRARS